MITTPPVSGEPGQAPGRIRAVWAEAEVVVLHLSSRRGTTAAMHALWAVYLVQCQTHDGGGFLLRVT